MEIDIEGASLFFPCVSNKARDLVLLSLWMTVIQIGDRLLCKNPGS